MRPPRGVVLAIALVVAMLLAVGLAAGATDADDQREFIEVDGENVSTPLAPPDHESTERLTLADEETVLAESAVKVDPTVATGISFAQLEAEYNKISLEAAMDDADGSMEEVAVVSEELERLEAEIGDEIALQEETYAAMAAGEIDEDEFLREVTMIYLRSTVIDAELDALSDALRDVIAPVTRDDAQRLRGEVSQAQLEVKTLQGPVTERGAGVMTGADSSITPISIEVGEHGYVLATVDDGVYVREAVATENRERGSGAGFTDIEQARALTAELYPWTVAESQESEDVPRGEIFSSTIDHPHGTTTIYLDRDTERPFRDGHVLNLFSIPTVEAYAESSGGVQITVERTYVGGPAHVQVVDTTAGEPIDDVTIHVADRAGGTSNQAGGYWFIAPESTFEIELELEDDTVTIPIEIPE